MNESQKVTDFLQKRRHQKSGSLLARERPHTSPAASLAASLAAKSGKQTKRHNK
jgi:hypothetical protein